MQTAMHLAAWNGNEKCLLTLLSHGAVVGTKNVLFLSKALIKNLTSF
jgi:hypothetical protein